MHPVGEEEQQLAAQDEALQVAPPHAVPSPIHNLAVHPHAVISSAHPLPPLWAPDNGKAVVFGVAQDCLDVVQAVYL